MSLNRAVDLALRVTMANLLINRWIQAGVTMNYRCLANIVFVRYRGNTYLAFANLGDYGYASPFLNWCFQGNCRPFFVATPSVISLMKNNSAWLRLAIVNPFPIMNPHSDILFLKPITFSPNSFIPFASHRLHSLGFAENRRLSESLDCHAPAVWKTNTLILHLESNFGLLLAHDKPWTGLEANLKANNSLVTFKTIDFGDRVRISASIYMVFISFGYISWHPSCWYWFKPR